MNVKMFGECQFMGDVFCPMSKKRAQGFFQDILRGSFSAIWVAPKGQMAGITFFYKAVVPTGHDQHF